MCTDYNFHEKKKMGKVKVVDTVFTLIQLVLKKLTEYSNECYCCKSM